MKKEILKLTGLTESQFYEKYPTQAAFEADYPEMKLGGTPEAFPQIATANNFFSYGVPVPPTYYMSGGPVYPQIQTETQFFSPVYSNSNNAYAVGGSYMEAYPQAKVYPQGPVGGSSFYMMQDGGQGMPEPQKDQTFYTQKMNSFFDKLRQAAYKNLQNGIMNSEPDTTSAMPELGMGRKGGMLSYQGNTSTSQTTIPAPGTVATPLDGANNQPAAATTTTTPGYRTVTDENGVTYIISPNNQLYSPFKGNQTAATNTQQQVYNPYPYRNRNGVYVGTGLDNVANFLIPNNQRERYRNIREQQGLGFSDLRPEQLKAILSGSANVSEFDLKTRAALLRRNQLKSLNVKFNTPGQNATATQTKAPMLMPGQKGYDPTVTNQKTTTANNQQQPSTTTTTPGTTADNPSTATPETAAVQASNQQAAKSFRQAYWEEPDSEEIEEPANERMRLQKEKEDIEAERKNFENYNKIREMQIRQGKTPDDYDFNRNYDYQSKAASVQGTVDYSPPSQNVVSNPAANPTTSTGATTITRSQAPSNANSMDANVAKKKAAMQNPNVNQEFIDAQKPKYTIGKVIPNADAKGSLESWADIEKAIGPTPEIITGSYFEKINDYCRQFPGAQGCYSEPYSKLPGQENIGSGERRNYFDTEKFKQMPYVQQVLMAIESPEFRRGINNEAIDPYETIGAPFRLLADYDKSITDYSKTTRDGKITNSPAAFTDVDPAYRFRYSDDAQGFYSQFMTPEMARELESTIKGFTKKKHGGPYVLPMYQGLIGPSTTGTTTTGFQAPWQRTLNLINEDNYKLNAEGKSEYVGPDEFEIGLDFGKTKKEGVNPYVPVMLRGVADYINQSQENAAQERNKNMMSRADQMFNTFDQFRGDYTMNQPTGADFRPDQMVPVGYTGAGYVAQQGGTMMFDVADLFFLTPQMLKKTTSRR